MRRARPIVRRLAPTLALLALWSPSPAFAEDSVDAATRKAREHFDRGRELFASGLYDEALREFEAAERIKPAPANHYNIAQAYEKLGDIPSAVEAYRHYLDGLPDAPDREVIEGKVHTLEAVLRATPTVGYVRIDLAEAGTKVWIDAELQGSTPLAAAIELEGGKHDVRLEKRGFSPWEGTITVVPGGSIVVAASLVRDEPAPRSHGAAWVVTGATAGALLVGLGLGGGALAINGGVRNEGPVNATAVRLALAADVAYGTAAVLGVTAIVVWVASRRPRAAAHGDTAHAAVAPLLGPGVWGAAFEVGF